MVSCNGYLVLTIVSLQVERTVHCEACCAPIGYSDPQNEGIRLFKWSLRMATFEGTPLFNLPDEILEPSMAKIISAHFLAMMNASCVSRLVVVPSPASEPGITYKSGLSIWIFNPSIRYTASYFYFSRKMHVSSLDKPGILAMKILWKTIPLDQYSSAEDESVEEMKLPGNIWREFQHYLGEISQRYLPPSARKLQDWNVSLLERYEPAEKVA